MILLSVALTGCVRKISIEQGNILTPEIVNQVRVGMSAAEVRNILGSPVLLNTFRDNRVDYVYTFNPGRGQTTEKTFTLIFENDRVAAIHSNL
jgi:outer membrane protein assembly factor BamE